MAYSNSKRSRLHSPFCRISEEIYGTNGEIHFVTRGCGCLVKSKDLQRSLHAKSKVFLVTTVEVLDIQYVELQMKQNKKFKIIAEFLKTDSSTVFETYDLNESFFGSLSDVYVVNGVTFIALTRVDKWYLGWKSIVSSRPLDFKFKNSDSNKSKEAFSCYVLLEAIGNHMKGFIPRQYDLKYAGKNFFLMRKGDSQAEKYVHSIRRFDENEVGLGAAILNESKEFIGVVRFENHSVLPVNVQGIFCEDTESLSLEEVCEDYVYSDPNARELDESPIFSQPMNNTNSQSLAMGVEVETSKGSAIAEDSALGKHIKTSNIFNEISPDDNSDCCSKTDNLNDEASLLRCGESIQSEEALPGSLMAPLPKEQRGTGNNYGEQPGGSTNALTLTQNDGAKDGSDLICSGGTSTEEVNTPPDEQKNLNGIGLPSSKFRSTNETSMKNSLNVGSSTNCVEQVGQQTLTGRKLLEGKIHNDKQLPYDYDSGNEDDIISLGLPAFTDFSHTKHSNSNGDSQNGALANRTLLSSKGSSCAGSQQSNSINADDEMEDVIVEKSYIGVRPQQSIGPSTVNPLSPNVSLLNSATRQKLLPKIK